MQVLYTKTNEELAAATPLFQRYMEPLLKKNEDAAHDGHSIARRRLSQDYRDVCRWPFRQLEYSFAIAAIMDHGAAGVMRWMPAVESRPLGMLWRRWVSTFVLVTTIGNLWTTSRTREWRISTAPSSAMSGKT